MRTISRMAFMLFMAATFAQAGTTVDIYPGADIPSVVDANPAGTTFIIYPGVYRVGTSQTKTGDSFIGSTSCAPPADILPGDSERLETAHFVSEDGYLLLRHGPDAKQYL